MAQTIHEILGMVTGRWPFKNKEQRELIAYLKQFPFHVAFTIGGQKWFCYDDLTHISVGRSGQIEAIAAQASLNITQEDLKYLTGVMQQLLEMPQVEMASMQTEAAKILQEGFEKAPPERVKTLLKRMAATDIRPMKVAIRLQEELSKRMELLAHEEFLFRLAAVMFWVDGEDPRLTLMPEQINEKAEFLKKKADSVLQRLLMSPVANILYHLNQSDNDSVTSLMMALRMQKPFHVFSDMMLTKQGLKGLVSSPSGTTHSTPLTKEAKQSSGKQGEIKTVLTDGSEDLKQTFLNTLRNSQP
jgi:hypothetical protein